MPTRDDYILRFLDQIGLALTEALRFRKAGKIEQAIIAVVVAQEKLFARPAAEFTGLDLGRQMHLLTIGEPPANAAIKCLGYAALLREAGNIYAVRNRADLAESAFQTALYVALSGGFGATVLGESSIDLARDLLARIPPEKLQAPVKELLAKRAAEEDLKL
jgi:hypothetical protein